MYFSSWLLKKFISVDDTPQNIKDVLTLKSCEIEGYETRQIPQGVVIGKVIKMAKHPNADKLWVCEVDIGKEKIQIITWATNLKEGAFVPVAVDGTFLPAVNMTIQSRPMRGLESNWMICSKSELGIPEDEEQKWIWILDEDFDDLEESDIWTPLIHKYPWLQSTVFEVDNKTLTHRPDLFGHLWIGIELNAIYRLLDPNKIKFNSLPGIFAQFRDTNLMELLQSSPNWPIEVEVQTPDSKTYILMHIKNINIKRSSFLTRLSLYDLQTIPKNNWVDFSNLFMFLTSQPVHFFDADKIEGKVIVRNAREGEEFEDLTGNKHILSSDDIVIADEKKILALAGIIWWASSQITSQTKNIAVEIAHFDPVKIRRTGLRLGLRTDAQVRFEKSPNPNFSAYALILFLDLLKAYQKDLGGYELNGLNRYLGDFNPEKIIDYPREDINKILFGQTEGIPHSKMDLILEWLGFEIQGNTVKVPIFRSLKDINILPDLAEEVWRIRWYDKISTHIPTQQIKYQSLNKIFEIERELVDVGVRDFHFDQVETYPWISESLLEIANIDFSDVVKIINSLDPASTYLRPFVFLSLIEVLQKNFRYFDQIRILDIGRSWEKQKEYRKISYLRYQKEGGSFKDSSILHLKSMIVWILTRLGLKNAKIAYKKHDLNLSRLFHTKQAGKILVNDNEIGFVGTLSPLAIAKLGFEESSQIGILELDIQKIVNILDTSINSKVLTLSDKIFYKDLSVVIDLAKDEKKLVQLLESMDPIQEVYLKDVYVGEGVPEGKKSITLTLKIVAPQDMKKWFFEEFFGQVMEKLRSEGFKLRGEK